MGDDAGGVSRPVSGGVGRSCASAEAKRTRRTNSDWGMSNGKWEEDAKGQGEGETRRERKSPSLSPCLLVSSFPNPHSLFPFLFPLTFIVERLNYSILPKRRTMPVETRILLLLVLSPLLRRSSFVLT